MQSSLKITGFSVLTSALLQVTEPELSDEELAELITEASDSVQEQMSAGQTQQASQTIINVAEQLNQQAAEQTTVTEVSRRA